MFKELGYKLKFAAYFVYGICVAAFVVLAVFMILEGNLFGYVIGFSSVLISWIPGAVVYAIGEMYEKVMYAGKEVPIFKTKAQKQDEKDVENLERVKHLQGLQNKQTLPEYDKLKKLKELQTQEAKTKKIKIDDKYRETDI